MLCRKGRNVSSLFQRGGQKSDGELVIACTRLVFCALGGHARSIRKAKTHSVGTGLFDGLRHVRHVL